MFEGLMPAMVTPFDADGEPDLRATEAVVKRHIEAGVSGICALGSNGEFSHLTETERMRFAGELAGIVAGRVPLLVGIKDTVYRLHRILLANSDGGFGALPLGHFSARIDRVLSPFERARRFRQQYQLSGG